MIDTEEVVEEVTQGDEKDEFTDIAEEVDTLEIFAAGTIDEPVQLWSGGPYWATCNLGADSPEKSGYFLTAKKTSDGNGVELDKAVDHEGKSVSSFEIPQGFRMPSKSDFQNLITTSKVSYLPVANYNSTGVSGISFTSKSDTSKSIFLPKVGYWADKSSGLVHEYTTEGFYRSGTINQMMMGGSTESLHLGMMPEIPMPGQAFYTYVSLRLVTDFIVTFDSKGGSSVPVIYALNGEKIEEPEEPEKEGYLLDGWYKEADCINRWDFDNDVVTKDTTLYAKWVLSHKVTVTISDPSFGSVDTNELFVPDGSVYIPIKGTVSETPNYPELEFSIDEEVIKSVKATTNRGYCIKEWSSDSIDNSIVKDTNITAHIGYATYKITVDNGIENGKISLSRTLATMIDPISVTVIPEEGYQLKAGSLKVTYTDDDGATQTITPSQDTQDQTKYNFTMPPYPATVTAEFEAAKSDTYAVTFAAGPGVKSAAIYSDMMGGTKTFTADQFPQTLPLMAGGEIIIKSVECESGYTCDLTLPYTYIVPDHDDTFTITAGRNSDPKPTPVNNDTKEEREPLFTGTWNNPVKSGSWSQDAHGIWHYTSSETFRNTWAYILNPYAHDGQNTSDWFWFDRQGNMLTGWQFINGKWYYLNPTKDGTLGACLIGRAVTPDGWTVDESGAWIESIPKK